MNSNTVHVPELAATKHRSFLQCDTVLATGAGALRPPTVFDSPALIKTLRIKEEEILAPASSTGEQL